MATLHFGRDIPVRHQVDVFVAGGGPAGLAAALAAARAGRSVYLAEGTGCFGGMGTSGLVPAFMQFGDGQRFVAGGIGREVYDRLWDAGGTGPRDDRKHPNHACAINAEVLKRVYDDMVLSEKNIRFTFFTQVLALQKDGSRPTHAVCHGKSGLFAVQSRMFVDGTGDGDLAVWAGAGFDKGDEHGAMMPGTLCSQFANIDWPAVVASGVRPSEAIERALADGVFTKPDRHVPGIWATGRDTGGGNIGHAFGVDGTDERSLTEAMLDGRRTLPEFLRFYREYRPGFQQLALTASGALLGIRETRRIVGDYRMTVDDFQNRASFEDEIGRYSYPVDIHPSRPGKETYQAFLHEFTTLRYQPGETYGIPYRILRPQGLSNLLVAGRCVSTDRAMQASIRVMPACFLTGQAAGLAAAMACDHGEDTRSVPVADLQQQLKRLGAYLPNLP